MIDFLKYCVLAFIGFSSGMVVSGGIFAFIAAIGVVERLAQKTKTIKHIKIYEDAVIIGGITGCINMFWKYNIKWGMPLSFFYHFCVGIFIGSLAVSLAEVLDVMPVFMRRSHLTTGLIFFIWSLAIGKAAGSLIYFTVSGFH